MSKVAIATATSLLPLGMCEMSLPSFDFKIPTREERLNVFVALQLNAWLLPGQPVITDSYAREVIACLQKLFRMMHVSWSDEFVLPMIVYVARYVARFGQTDCTNLMNVVLASALATSKFWGDDVPTIDYSLVAFVSGMKQSEVSTLEKNFLAAIDFALLISPEEMERWRTFAYSSFP